MSNHIHYKVWDEIIYSFPNFNSATIEIWEWISHFIPHLCDYLSMLWWTVGRVEFTVVRASWTRRNMVRDAVAMEISMIDAWKILFLIIDYNAQKFEKRSEI